MRITLRLFRFAADGPNAAHQLSHESAQDEAQYILNADRDR